MDYCKEVNRSKGFYLRAVSKPDFVKSVSARDICIFSQRQF